jgi:hypothetical protein
MILNHLITHQRHNQNLKRGRGWDFYNVNFIVRTTGIDFEFGPGKDPGEQVTIAISCFESCPHAALSKSPIEPCSILTYEAPSLQQCHNRQN